MKSRLNHVHIWPRCKNTDLVRSTYIWSWSRTIAQNTRTYSRIRPRLLYIERQRPMVSNGRPAGVYCYAHSNRVEAADGCTGRWDTQQREPVAGHCSSRGNDFGVLIPRNGVLFIEPQPAGAGIMRYGRNGVLCIVRQLAGAGVPRTAAIGYLTSRGAPRNNRLSTLYVSHERGATTRGSSSQCNHINYLEGPLHYRARSQRIRLLQLSYATQQ